MQTSTELERAVGLSGAILMGLGSMIGTGVFVGIGIAAGVAGPSVVLAIAAAALVATGNALSSAQLAAAYPVSGGTYEYGYRLLGPRLGFVAGWLFLCAKSASAATAALGVAGYVLAAAGVDPRWRAPFALGLVVALTAVVAGGVRRSNRTNAVIVAITVIALIAFVAAGVPAIDASRLRPIRIDGDLLEATALCFVAYTGYGRIATMGEEVRDPERTIPRAVVGALAACLVLYVAVAVVAVGAVGAGALADITRTTAAPLPAVAQRFPQPGAAVVVAVGAVTALIGVVLNLLLGLSRVVLAMARRGDVPRALAVIDDRTPRRAVIATGVAIAALVLIGDVSATWSFSAFTVLVYYAITNLAALRLPAPQRRYPRAIAGLGLIACLGLAFWVELRVWLIGLVLIAAGLGWHAIVTRARR